MKRWHCHEMKRPFFLDREPVGWLREPRTRLSLWAVAGIGVVAFGLGLLLGMLL